MSSLITLSFAVDAFIQFFGPGTVGGRSVQAFPQVAIIDAGGLRSADLEVTSSEPARPTKLQRWSGSLVDAACMSSALREVPPLDQLVYPLPPLPWTGTTVDGPPPTAQGPGTGEGYPPGSSISAAQANRSTRAEDEPEISKRELEMQAADLKRARMVEHAVKTCTPKTPTAHFGLLVSGEHLLKFNASGDVKAKQALRVAMNQPGKTVKAKVTGVIEAVDRVEVASIEIKARIPTPEILSESRGGW